MRLSSILIAAALVIAGLAPTAALAQTVFPTSNPNAQEWALINLTPATVASANGGAGVNVGLFDGLTDCRDTDLTGRCTNTLFTGGTYHYYDNHGTHTAGTIAGARYGEATRASVFDYAVFDDAHYVPTGSGLSNAWISAAGRGASIASMSFGCTRMALCFSSTEVRAMASSSLSGTLFVKAAGNDGTTLVNESIAVSSADAQTAMSRLILVGSVNLSGAISSFSNRPGETCLLPSGATACTSATQWKNRFIVAPGELIYATLPGNQYGYMSGTSMATPIVAGAAALLEARWPQLKSQPATVANILLNSATDLGAPGVDAVYGHGLLNVGRAFQASGTTSIVSPTGATTAVSGTTVNNPPVMGRTAVILGNVTAYDAYGRDYHLSELPAFQVRGDGLQLFGIEASPVVDMGRQSDWSGAFFALSARPRAFAAFGSLAADGRQQLSLDQSLRAGVDAPFGTGSMSLRLTGAADTRADFAADPALAPMGFFASTDLLSQSMVSSATLPIGPGRLMLYGASSLGGHLGPSPFANELALPNLRGVDDGGALGIARTPMRQSAVGAGYWMRPDSRTVVGFTASQITQRHGFYDFATNMSVFDGSTRLYNAGVAASRSYGEWDLFASAEVTALQAPKTDGPVRFTDGTLVSGEAGVRRSNLFLHDGPRHDVLAVTVRALPQAVRGSLELDYMTPTADGMGSVAVSARTPLAEITGRTTRVETSYAVVGGRGWSMGLAAGANLSGAPEQQLMVRAHARF